MINTTRLFLDCQKVIDGYTATGDTESVEIFTRIRDQIAQVTHENIRLKAIHNSPVYPEMLLYKTRSEKYEKRITALENITNQFISTFADHTEDPEINDLITLASELVGLPN
jgi:hypothetical protein